MPFTEIETIERGVYFRREIRLSLGSSNFQMAMRTQIELSNSQDLKPGNHRNIFMEI